MICFRERGFMVHFFRGVRLPILLDEAWTRTRSFFPFPRLADRFL